jgi:SAM-dependent methyltransferase
VGDLRESWKSERLRAAVYDYGVQTYPINAVAARLLWGYDVGELWRSVGRLARDPDDTTVLDLPCGGGIGFRALSRGRRLRYVAADLSPVMLDRARAAARRRGLDQVEFVQADVGALPFPDASFDVCVTLNGLHCFPDPAAAVAEFGRVLRPGGTLRGTSIVRGTGGRRDLLIRLFQRRGLFGPGGRADDLAGWLGAAGLTDADVTVDGAVAAFTARRPALP